MNISLINGFQEGILEERLYLFGQFVPMSLVENTRSHLGFSLNLGTTRRSPPKDLRLQAASYRVNKRYFYLQKGSLTN